VQNLVQLVDIVAALEEWPTTEKFGQNTADGPNINYNAFVRKSGNAALKEATDDILALV
jgi:hypothetical protein